jgi:hypothetical protein
MWIFNERSVLFSIAEMTYFNIMILWGLGVMSFICVI